MSRPALRLRACAKINWALEVVGRREDGYHEVRTILQTIALCDELSVSVADGSSFHVSGPAAASVPSGRDNLAVRAFELYRQRIATSELARWRFQIGLLKRISTAAGLGGGSSDGAAALRALDGLNAEPIGTDRLESLAAELGSDIAFFIRGGTQFAVGRGERLSRLPDAPRAWFVVVSPPITIPNKTARLYAMLRPEHFGNGRRTEALAASIRSGAKPKPDSLINTFDSIAACAYPGIEIYRQALLAQCGNALLCGAGPSLFAIVPDEGTAREDAAQLRALGMATLVARSSSAADSIAAVDRNRKRALDILR